MALRGRYLALIVFFTVDPENIIAKRVRIPLLLYWNLILFIYSGKRTSIKLYSIL